MGKGTGDLGEEGKRKMPHKRGIFLGSFLWRKSGAPGVTRTRDPLLRKQVLYPN
jgi:hypothetical protein